MTRRWIAAFAFVAPACALIASCAGTPQGIIQPGTRWEEVSRSGLVFGEGVVATADGAVYFSSMTRALPPGPDNPGGTIYKFDHRTLHAVKYLEPSGMSNGMFVDRRGDLLICQDSGSGGKGGDRAVVRRNLATGSMTTVAERYQGKRFNGPNDITGDPAGRIYFTDARYTGSEPMELPNAVYRVDTDGTITQIIADLWRPNGIEVSPDGRRLYVAVNGSKQLPTNPNGPHKVALEVPSGGGGVVMYDLDPNGNVSGGRLILSNEEVAPDGMAMDVQGNLYVAMHSGNPKARKVALVVLDPEGRLLERLPSPDEGLTTNLGFGRGADAGSLYATTAFPMRLYRLKTVRRGHYLE